MGELPAGFGELPLRQLTLDGCHQLSLPESFIRLQLSDENFMKCCKAVARLPESIVEHHLFKDAATLNLSGAKLVALPERFGQLENLRELELWNCSSLKELPAGFGQLRSLVSLNLYDCRALKALPEGFGEQLVNLQTLILRNCHALKELPAGFGQLESLQ